MAAEPLSFAEFQATLAGLLDVEPGQLAAETDLAGDLGIDSLRLLQLMLELEAQGIQIPPDLAWQVRTVGEAYEFYQEAVKRPFGPTLGEE